MRFRTHGAANASSDQIDGVADGVPGMLLATNGLRMALMSPDASLVTAVTKGDIGFGAGAAVGSAFGVATDNDCVVAIRGDAAASVGSGDQVGASAHDVGCLLGRRHGSVRGVCDRGYRCRNLRLGGLGRSGSDPSLLRGG